MNRHAEPRTGSQFIQAHQMRIQARNPIPLRPSKAALGTTLVLLACAICAPAAVWADVGDQYLPQIPDAGGKKDKYGTEVQTAAAAPATTTQAQTQTKPAKERKKPEKPVEKLQVAPAIDPGGGPGAGSVIAVALLGVALVGAVLWLVARGRRTLAEAEGHDVHSHQPETPRGEITGEGSASQQRRS